MKYQVEKAISVLKNGGVILYPTDTVWGLGCDATNEGAVKKLFAIKKRMEDKSVICLVDNFEMIQNYADIFDENIKNLFLNERPTTVILPQGKKMAKGVINQNGSVAFRIPNTKFCQALLKNLKKPLVSTSANVSGQKTPSFFKEVGEEIKKAVDYIVPEEFEENATHQPSRILLLNEAGEVLVIRD